MPNDFADSAANDINNYADDILSGVSSIGTYLNDIQSRNTDIGQKQQIQIDQLKEIQEKEKLLLTRSRMLQISQDRNSYKKKIIYTLLSIIFIIFIIIIFAYVLFKKKMALPRKI
jgi:predicted PurR-regulated permease PerM